MDSKDAKENAEGGKMFTTIPVQEDRPEFSPFTAAPGPVRIQGAQDFPAQEGTLEDRQKRKEELNKK